MNAQNKSSPITTNDKSHPEQPSQEHWAAEQALKPRDIVTELREEAATQNSKSMRDEIQYCGKLLTRAADEIERLRAGLTRIAAIDITEDRMDGAWDAGYTTAIEKVAAIAKTTLESK